MLSPIDSYAAELSTRLEGLSPRDQDLFCPHAFDLDTIKQLASEPGNHYYAYLSNEDVLAGYGMLRTFGRYAVPTLGCVVWDENRGRGHGRKLVAELIEQARRLAFENIKLKCHQDNQIAMALYGSMGFQVLGEVEAEHYWMEYCI